MEMKDVFLEIRVIQGAATVTARFIDAETNRSWPVDPMRKTISLAHSDSMRIDGIQTGVKED